MEQMLQDRRRWINEQREIQLGKIPDEIKPFYDRNNVETPLTPEEQAAKDAAAEEEGGKKKKKGEKKKEKKKKGKKGKGDDDGDAQIVKIGPSEVVQRFDEHYGDFNEEWVNRDETSNYKQEHDSELLKVEVMPVLEEEYKTSVDDMIKMELENMRMLSGVKAKKKKGKGKKKKGKKGKKKKGLKLPGYKMIKEMVERDIKEVLVLLINENIVKKIPPQALTDFIGEFNYIHSMLDDIKQQVWDPSMALIRQLVTEYIIFPLGSELVKKRFPEHVRSFLFYGPPGSGKTMVVRACVSETNSIFFDMSPTNID
jgi:SpoVK/Ycf46/Vps4 family AAA+-type ATPase